MSRVLLFSNPEFAPGTNVTVRRGVKWALGETTGIGVATTDNPDAVLFTTEIAPRVFVFSSLRGRDDILDYEHDPSCQTYDGLLAEMQRIYPGFSEDEVVTVLEFTGTGEC